MLFGGTFVFVTFACFLCHKLGMAESQRGGERDIDIESRRELNAVADNSAVSERIVALKKSKASLTVTKIDMIVRMRILISYMILIKR